MNGYFLFFVSESGRDVKIRAGVQSIGTPVHALSDEDDFWFAGVFASIDEARAALAATHECSTVAECLRATRGAP